MADIISNIISDKQEIKNQLGTVPEVISSIKNFEQQVFLRPTFVKQFVLVPNDSFILGSATNGVLGTNKLGDRRTEENSFVFPFRNIIEEDLLDTEYIDEDNTTATLNLDGTADFTAGDILESEIVCKIGSAINSIKFLEYQGINYDASEMRLDELQLGISTFSDTNVVIEVSNNAGLNWFTLDDINNRVFFSQSSSTDEFKYRITAISNFTLTAPLKIKVN